MVTYALSAGEFGNRILEHIVEPLVALMAFVALLLFIITAIRFVHNADSSGKRSTMFKSMAVIIFGIFVIFSIYTIFIFVGRLANSPINLEEQRVRFDEYELVERDYEKLRELQRRRELQLQR